MLKRFLVFLFFSPLLSASQATTSFATSYNWELSKIETIEVLFSPNIERKNYVLLKENFYSALLSINQNSLVTVVPYDSRGMQNGGSIEHVRLVISLKKICNSSNDKCAYAVFPVVYWSGIDLSGAYCRDLFWGEDLESLAEIRKLAWRLVLHLEDCIVDPVNNIKQMDLELKNR